MSTSKRQLAGKRLAASLFFALTVPVVSAQINVTLTGHVPLGVLNATRLGRVATEEPIRLSLAVRLDDALLKETLDQIYGPQAPANKRFLTSAEFAQTFDLLAKREQLKQFAQAHGMAVVAEEDRPDSMVVRVSGSTGTIEQAFGVQLNRYRDATGRVFRAHESDPIIPATIKAHLSAILGLSDVQGAFSPRLEGSPVESSFEPFSLSGSGPGGGMAPSDITSIYELPTALTGGTGQTVALFELAQFNPTDLATYTNQFHLPNVPMTIISMDGFTSFCPPGQCVGLGTAEVDLDTELIAAVAPGVSQILVYDGPNTQQGAMDIYNQIATDNLAQVVSTSWGESESQAGSALLQAENQVFQRMAIQGQSIFAASGDNGAYGSGGMLAYDPSAQPYVTSVGGTSLSGTLQAPVETAWSESGGGLSGFWPLPAYQTGVPGVVSQQFRNVPDVALNADPRSPYATYVDGTWMRFGGTSATAPLWAGFTALVNQQRMTSGLPLLGFANPLLYQLAETGQYGNLYRDITSGNNGSYSAGPGYDDVTGWGSYLGAPLLHAMAGVTSDATIFSPGAGQYIVGSVTITGSAFAPNFASYRVEYGEGAKPGVFHLIGSVHASAVTFGVLETWNTSILPTDIYTLRLTVTNTSNQTTITTTTPIYVDNTPPPAPAQASLTAPNSTTLTLSWTPSTDSIGVAGYLVDLSTSAQFLSYVSTYQNFDAKNVTTLTINSATPSTTYFARVRAYDGLGSMSQNSPAAQATTPATVTPPGQAVYDSTLMAPACHLTGNTCDSAGLLIGRANLAGGGAEPNQPNTLFNSCADGTAGIYHASESNDHLTVSTLTSQPFAPGATMRVSATVWANINFGADWLDLYYAANANAPVWTLIGTLRATAAGAQTLSMTYTLPSGPLQAVRAVFRNGGRPSACTTGTYDDHDDLAFAVGSTTGPVINSPANATGTVGSAFSYAITASNNPISYNATGLPTGLKINTSTGLISGSPQSTGTSTITLSATNAGGTGTGTLVLTISPPATPPPAITSPLTASGIDGSTFSYSITATNNPASYNAVGLPSGLSINMTSGVISGIPATTGVFAVTLTASNTSGTGTASLKLTITAALPPSAPVAALTVTPTSGTGPLTVTGDASGSTGGNLSYAWNFGDHSTGYGAVVTHTYTQAGTYSITVTVSNSLGSAHTRSLVVVTGN